MNRKIPDDVPLPVSPENLICKLLDDGSAGDDVIRTLDAYGFVIVPREPTKEMLDEAWASALAEDAAGVWGDMIEAWLTPASSPRDSS